MASAQPIFRTNKKSRKSKFVIKSSKVKPFSSHNPKNFQEKMQNWFSAKLEEEENLYKEYLINLGRQTGLDKMSENKSERNLISKYLNKSKLEFK